MRSLVWIAGLALLTIAEASATPVAFRLASLPSTAEPGQKLVLCAANVGTGALDVSLQFINVRTGGVVAEKTIKLEPLGAGATLSPCITTTAEALAGAGMNQVAQPAVRTTAQSAFAADMAAASTPGGESLVVGVALVRRFPFAFRQAQVTASIQVVAPDANGVMRTVQTIPLSRTTHPGEAAPVYAPVITSDGGAHK